MYSAIKAVVLPYNPSLTSVHQENPSSSHLKTLARFPSSTLDTTRHKAPSSSQLVETLPRVLGRIISVFALSLSIWRLSLRWARLCAFQKEERSTSSLESSPRFHSLRSLSSPALSDLSQFSLIFESRDPDLAFLTCTC